MKKLIGGLCALFLMNTAIIKAQDGLIIQEETLGSLHHGWKQLISAITAKGYTGIGYATLIMVLVSE